MSDANDDLRREMLRFSEQLAAGASRIAGLGASATSGTTPRRVVLVMDDARLFHYRSPVPQTGAPLLIVYALVNRPHMLDLEAGRSFIGGLLDAGRDVYLLDWGTTGSPDPALGLDDYILRYVHGCVEFLSREHAVPAVDLVGVCQGGTFSLCYAALEPLRVRRLALLVTPVDFHTPDFLLARWTKYVDVERLVETFGNVPGSLLNQAFLALKPLSLSHDKARGLMDLMRRPEELASFARMEQWLHDSPDQAGRAFREFIEAFVRDNALVAGGLDVGGRAVDLSSVRCPVLNVFATRDHIVPPDASRALGPLLTNAPCSEWAFDGGHIGVFASRRAQAEVPAHVARWLRPTDTPSGPVPE